MDPGELDKRIDIVGMVKTGRDAAGAPVTQPVLLEGLWAKVVQQGGREFLANDGERTEKRVVFRTWALKAVEIDTTAIVKYRGQDHDIKDIRDFDDVWEIHTAARINRP